jgi:hypothetical protein
MIKFVKIASKLLKLQDLIYTENKNLRLVKDILLPKLMSGEINVFNVEI